jgi:hypothetical protein
MVSKQRGNERDTITFAISPINKAQTKVAPKNELIVKMVQVPGTQSDQLVKLDWHSQFLAGWVGFKARIWGVEHEFHELSRSRGSSFGPYEQDYHLAALFFAMDSALECLAYAMNAIGWACCASRDCKCYKKMHVENALRSINLGIFRKTNNCSNTNCPPFAAVRACWQSPANKTCIDRLTEQHDVSKHRGATVNGHDKPVDIGTTPVDSEYVPDGSEESIGEAPAQDYILHAKIKTLVLEKATADALGKPYKKPFDELLKAGDVFYLRELMEQYKILIEETAKAFESDIDALLAKY